VAVEQNRVRALAALASGVAALSFGVGLRFFPHSSEVGSPRLGVRWLITGLVIICTSLVASYVARPRKNALFMTGLLPLAGIIAVLMPVLSVMEPIVRDQFLPGGLEAAGGLALIAAALRFAHAHAAQSMFELKLNPKRKVRLSKEGAKRTDVAVEALIPGDEFELGPGDDVPIDGTIVSGSGFVDESSLIGPSLPRAKKAGDPVLAGSSSSIPGLVVRVGAPFEDSMVVQREQLASTVAEDLSTIGVGGKIGAAFVVLFALGCLAVVAFRSNVERLEEWLPAAAGVCLACLSGAPGLALARGLLRTFIVARISGMIVARPKDVVALSSAKRWQIDPRLIAAPGEVEVLALGDESNDRLLQVAEALVAGELSPELGSLTAQLRRKKLGSASGAALRRAQSVYYGTVDGVRWYMGPQRAVEEEEKVELERSLEGSMAFLRDKGLITWLMGKPSEGIVGAIGIGVTAESEAKVAAMKLHAAIMPGLPDATRKAVADAAAIACDGPPLSKRDGTLLAETSPSPSTGLRVRVLKMRPGIELRSDRSPRILAAALPSFPAAVESARAIAWRARARALLLAVVPVGLAAVLAWYGVLSPLAGTVIGFLALLSTGRVRQTERTSQPTDGMGTPVDHDAVTLLSVPEPSLVTEPDGVRVKAHEVK
jgi:hypothetical protein